MTVSRKTHRTQARVKVVLESLKGEKTAAEITAKSGIHVTQVNVWKKAAFSDDARSLFRQEKTTER